MILSIYCLLDLRKKRKNRKKTKKIKKKLHLLKFKKKKIINRGRKKFLRTNIRVETKIIILLAFNKTEKFEIKATKPIFIFIF
jgi:hypothetical protein